MALKGQKAPGKLYHNNHDGTFTDVSEKSGLNSPCFAMGGAVGDYDNDGWPALYLTCFGGNVLYHNNGDGTFTDVTSKAGVADGRWSTGASFGDYDGDGFLDLMVTNYVDFHLDDLPGFGKAPNCKYRGIDVQCGPRGLKGVGDTLFHNNGNGTFTDVSYASVVALPSLPFVKWGTVFVDLDNDGWVDLVTVTGHVYPQVDSLPSGATYREPKLLRMNQKDGKFCDASDQAGPALMEKRVSRGLAVADLFNDGNMDVVISDIDGAPMILKNHGVAGRHWVSFELAGTKSNRLAIGARIKVIAGGMTQTDEIQSGGSYLSQNDLRLHFGLGAATRIDRVEIFWPSGKTDSLTNLAADEFYSVLEGSGIVPAVRVRPASPAKARPTPAPSAPSEQPHTLSLFGAVLSCRSWLFFETTPPPETISFDETSLRLSPLQRML